MDLAATDPLPDIPAAAAVGEPVYPAIKPIPTDIDLEPVPAPVLKRKFMLCVELPSLESVMTRYKKWEQVSSLTMELLLCSLHDHALDHRQETQERGRYILEDACRPIRSFGRP